MQQPKQKILLIEDDQKLAQLTQSYLTDAGFTVAIESDGNKAIDHFQRFTPDLIILDIMLPGKDGLTICKEIRPSFDGPILMLTARNEDFDQVLGLEFGADDYVIKPVEPRVLLARINALLRRSYSQKKSLSEKLKFGCLEIDIQSRKVIFEGAPASVSSHEFELLTLLAENAGNILSRDELFNQLYNRPYDGMDRSIDVRVSQLRKKFGDHPEDPFRIKTIWGKGYLFVADAW
ncbi:response regulator transcription factor [Aliikangiella coralliicola]|uniref:Response regulator transcription factor n=1 Tax=Aliikangiella coralliicola TaxID=2592383 RepID=A0A545UBQ9_9GAMM|nr:response regulator transcription factor [Aliikangiella coralliicola]TQV86900.1 response regulator transcription factor [Aliikangiella coralliicola]